MPLNDLILPVLASSFDGLLEGMVWFGVLIIASVCALLSLLLAPFLQMSQASRFCGRCALLLFSTSTLLLYFLVFPSFKPTYSGLRDTPSNEASLLELTRWTLTAFTTGTFVVLAAEVIASRRSLCAGADPKK